eukprot:5939851-Amphidinium_carterae.1
MVTEESVGKFRKSVSDEPQGPVCVCNHIPCKDNPSEVQPFLEDLMGASQHILAANLPGNTFVESMLMFPGTPAQRKEQKPSKLYSETSCARPKTTTLTQ